MPSVHSLLGALGQLLREKRLASQLTQAQVAKRAGIGAKYLSEIERGTRDLPMSTLRALVEDGLGLRLDVRFLDSQPETRLPRTIENAARAIGKLPDDQRELVLMVVRSVLRLAGE